MTTLQAKYDKALFHLENTKDDDYLVHFYTGFPDYDTLLAFYGTVLEEDAKVMRQWRSGKSKQKLRVVELQTSFARTIFLTLVRLRLGLLEYLAHRLACRNQQYLESY